MLVEQWHMHQTGNANISELSDRLETFLTRPHGGRPRTLTSIADARAVEVQ
jgi:hypothetical protein